MPARTDDVTDEQLAAGLLLARRGQAYFSRALHGLHDDDLDGPSLLPGWTRRHVAAHVGYNARALSRLVEWAETGVETPMYSSPAARDAEIELGATLPAHALRNLSDHAAVHLDVAWRDLPASAWAHEVKTAQGRSVPVAETVWMRTREVWLHAVDLDDGGSVDDFPPDLLDLLLADVAAVWARRYTGGHTGAVAAPPVMEPTDRGDASRTATTGAGGPVVAQGTAAQLVAWATGRTPAGRGSGVTAAGAPAPAAPPWL